MQVCKQVKKKKFNRRQQKFNFKLKLKTKQQGLDTRRFFLQRNVIKYFTAQKFNCSCEKKQYAQKGERKIGVK